MDVNGESIHGTQASPFAKLRLGTLHAEAPCPATTRLYLHVFDWPADGKLVVGGLLNHPRRAFLLGAAGDRALRIERRADGVAVSLPSSAPDAIDSVVVLDVDGPPNVAKSS